MDIPYFFRIFARILLFSVQRTYTNFPNNYRNFYPHGAPSNPSCSYSGLSKLQMCTDITNVNPILPKKVVRSFTHQPVDKFFLLREQKGGAYPFFVVPFYIGLSLLWYVSIYKYIVTSTHYLPLFNTFSHFNPPYLVTIPLFDTLYLISLPSHMSIKKGVSNSL